MTFRILIDTNVFVYATGKPHALKEPSIKVLELAARDDSFFTNAEVLQEILHQFKARKVWPAARARFDAAVNVMAGRVEPFFGADVEHAAILAAAHPRLAARDSVHVAVAVRVGAPYIVSTDSAFDDVKEIERLDPLRLDEWRDRVLVG